MDFLQYVVGPVGSGLLAGIVVAILNWQFGRRRTTAEINQMQSNATKLQEEGAKFALENKQTREQMARTQAALENISSRFFNDEDYIVYDGSMDRSHFRGIQSDFYGDQANAPIGQGDLRVVEGVLSLTRHNSGGRYRIILTKYRYNGEDVDHFPKNPMIAGDRRIRIRFEAKITDGKHTLAFSLKHGHSGGFEERVTQAVIEKQWESFEIVLRSKPNMQASLYIDDQDVSVPDSSIQIRKLVVSEIRSVRRPTDSNPSMSDQSEMVQKS